MRPARGAARGRDPAGALRLRGPAAGASTVLRDRSLQVGEDLGDLGREVVAVGALPRPRVGAVPAGRRRSASVRRPTAVERHHRAHGVPRRVDEAGERQAVAGRPVLRTRCGGATGTRPPVIRSSMSPRLTTSTSGSGAPRSTRRARRTSSPSRPSWARSRQQAVVGVLGHAPAAVGAAAGSGRCGTAPSGRRSPVRSNQSASSPRPRPSRRSSATAEIGHGVHPPRARRPEAGRARRGRGSVRAADARRALRDGRRPARRRSRGPPCGRVGPRSARPRAGTSPATPPRRGAWRCAPCRRRAGRRTSRASRSRSVSAPGATP